MFVIHQKRMQMIGWFVVVGNLKHGNMCAYDAGHMIDGFQRHAANAEGQNGFIVCVHDTVDVGVAFVDFRMDETFLVALGGIGIYG